jgi:hypothetical protein
VPSGKTLMYYCMELILENAYKMYQMFVNLLVEVIPQGVSMIHVEFSEFFRAEYFNGESTKQSGSLALLCGIQQCLIDIQNRCVRATGELSRLVIEIASQRPATLKDFWTQEFALERQTQLWEFMLCKFEPIGTHQEEITRMFSSCRFQTREEASGLNTATQNVIGFALSLLLDPSPRDAVPTCNLKKVFSTCREKFCSINGAPVGRLLDEGMSQERAVMMLAQAETKNKAPFGNSDGRLDKSDGLNPQFAKLKKELSLAQREILNLKNQLHQAKENISKERAESGSKSKKDDSPDEEPEVGSKRVCQQHQGADSSTLFQKCAYVCKVCIWQKKCTLFFDVLQTFFRLLPELIDRPFLRGLRSRGGSAMAAGSYAYLGEAEAVGAGAALLAKAA